MTKLYRDFADFLSEHFDGKVQKLSVNASFSCPNRDGTLGRGGCAYCNVNSFNPDYCRREHTVTSQIAQGRKFFSRKYPSMRYLAYFQAYTSTHAQLPRLIELYEEALACEGVAGLVIGTRPDCMPDSLLEYLSALTAKGIFVMIEYGAESSHDTTLNRVNRCHTWSQTVETVSRTHKYGIPVGIHLIMGLPGESDEMMLETVDRASSLPLSTIKLHQLQLVRGTRLALDVERGIWEGPKMSVDDYALLCARIVAHMSPAIAIERFTSQSPDDMLIAPRWGLKNYQFVTLVERQLRAHGWTQGCLAGDRP